MLRIGKYQFHARYLFVGAAIIAFGVIAWANRSDIVAVWSSLGDLRLSVLILLPVIQLLSYDSNAKFYLNFMRSLGHEADYKRLYEVSLGLNFVNQVFPSGGISGFSYFGYSLKHSSNEIPAGQSTLIQLGRYVLTYVSFIILLVIAGGLLYFGGSIERITVRILVILIGLIVLGSMGLVFVLNRHERIGVAVRWLTICVNVVAKPFRPKRTDLIGAKRIEKLLEDFHESYKMIKAQRRSLKQPFWYALAGNVWEVATIYVVFIAFATYVNPGAVILAYAIANLAGLIAIVPGGIGIYEALMVAVLASAGVPVAVGLSVTLVYRVLNMAIFLPIGFYYYTKHLKGKVEHG